MDNVDETDLALPSFAAILFDLDVSHEQQIDKVKGIFFVKNNHRAAARSNRHKLTMWDRDRTPIRQMKYKGLEGFAL